MGSVQLFIGNKCEKKRKPRYRCQLSWLQWGKFRNLQRRKM